MSGLAIWYNQPIIIIIIFYRFSLHLPLSNSVVFILRLSVINENLVKTFLLFLKYFLFLNKNHSFHSYISIKHGSPGIKTMTINKGHRKM